MDLGNFGKSELSPTWRWYRQAIRAIRVHSLLGPSKKVLPKNAYFLSHTKTLRMGQCFSAPPCRGVRGGISPPGSEEPKLSPLDSPPGSKAGGSWGGNFPPGWRQLREIPPDTLGIRWFLINLQGKIRFVVPQNPEIFACGAHFRRQIFVCSFTKPPNFRLRCSFYKVNIRL